MYACCKKHLVKGFFFVKAIQKDVKKRESYISNATQGTFSFENAIGMGNI